MIELNTLNKHKWPHYLVVRAIISFLQLRQCLRFSTESVCNDAPGYGFDALKSYPGAYLYIDYVVLVSHMTMIIMIMHYNDALR